MRILFVTPYPASRIRTRSYGFITQLAKRHTVKVVTLCANAQELSDVQALQREGIAALALDEPHLVRYLRALRALNSQQPLQVAFDASPRLRTAINVQLLSGQFDLLHVELVRTLDAVPLALPVPAVWDAVDCISNLYAQGGQVGSTPMQRLIGSSEAQRVRAYEYAQLHRFRHVLVTTQRERQALLSIAHANSNSPSIGTQFGDPNVRTAASAHPQEWGQAPAEVTVLPHGIDQQYFQPYCGRREPETLVFSGKMSFHANIAAVKMLIKQIMPLIWQQRPTVRLIIAGSNPPSTLRRLASHDYRVTVTGYLPDLRSVIAQAQVAVCPLPYAVGIQNKVLEAMALGTPVVASAAAAAGLQAIPGRDLLVANTPIDFAAAVLHLLENRTLWYSLVEHAISYIKIYHHWDTIIHRLVAVYGQALQTWKGQMHAQCM